MSSVNKKDVLILCASDNSITNRTSEISDIILDNIKKGDLAEFSYVNIDPEHCLRCCISSVEDIRENCHQFPLFDLIIDEYCPKFIWEEKTFKILSDSLKKHGKLFLLKHGKQSEVLSSQEMKERINSLSSLEKKFQYLHNIWKENWWDSLDPESMHADTEVIELIDNVINTGRKDKNLLQNSVQELYEITLDLLESEEKEEDIDLEPYFQKYFIKTYSKNNDFFELQKR